MKAKHVHPLDAKNSIHRDIRNFPSGLSPSAPTHPCPTLLPPKSRIKKKEEEEEDNQNVFIAQCFVALCFNEQYAVNNNEKKMHLHMSQKTHKNGRSSPIQNSPKPETTQMAIDSRIDKYTMVQSHNVILVCSDTAIYSYAQ